MVKGRRKAEPPDRGLTSRKWLGPEFFSSLPYLPIYLEARLRREGRVLNRCQAFWAASRRTGLLLVMVEEN